MPANTLSFPGRATYGLMAGLALVTAVTALRYLAPEPIAGAPPVLANRFADPFLSMHAGFGAIALLLGPIQFLPRFRAANRAIHRAIGTGYVAACLAGGAAGLVLAAGSTAGPVATAGFGGLALVWLYATSRGLAAALGGQYPVHRRWMIRSFALTLAAVTLRLQLPLSPLTGLDAQTAYLAISFACWIPNLVAAELYLAATAARTRTA